MKLWLDELKLMARQRQIPRALQEREAGKVEEQMRKLGVDVTKGEIKDGIPMLDVDLSKLEKPQDLFAALELAGTAAVSVEAKDITPLKGKNIATFSLMRAMQEGQASINTVPPNELWDELNTAMTKAAV